MIGKVQLLSVPHEGVATPELRNQWRWGGFPPGGTTVAVTSIYPDCGLAKGSPSRYGGSSACVFVNADAFPQELAWVSCHYTIQQVALDYVQSNLGEFIGILIGLEQLPDNWEGKVCCDSINAIRAWKSLPHKPDWVPDVFYQRAFRQYNRMGDPEYVLLSGHPTRKELAAGKSKEGRPVSPHNVRADALCEEEIQIMLHRPFSQETP